MLVRGNRAPSTPRWGRLARDDRWRPFAWGLAVVVLAATGATDSGPAAYALAGGSAGSEQADGDEAAAFDLPVDRLPSAVGDELSPWPDGPWSTLSETLPELAPAPQPLPGTFLFANALNGVPPQALTAYRDASDTLRADDPSCALDWSLLAGIGRVESNHGRYGGAVLGADGVSRPAIIGIALDGRPGVARILDTDGGRLDGDTVFDRAVGPMQFIPGTWASRAADGDRDGVADPHDIADAALSAAQYLCAGDGDLSTETGARAALMRYNRSVEYGTKVLTFARGYRDGTGFDELGGGAGLFSTAQWPSSPWRPGVGGGRPAWAPRAPFATAALGPLAGPIAAQVPFAAAVTPAARVDSRPAPAALPAAPGRPVVGSPVPPALPVQGPLTPAAPSVRPSPGAPFVTPWPTPSPTKPSTGPSAKPSPTTKPSPSPSAPFVKPSPTTQPTTPAKPSTSPSAKPSPTRPSTSPSAKPSPTKPSTSPSAKPAPTTSPAKPSPTKPSTSPSAKPSPTTTKSPTAPAVKPSPTTSPKPAAKPSPTRPPATSAPTPTTPSSPKPSSPKPTAPVPAPKPAPAPAPQPAPAVTPVPAPKPPAGVPAPAPAPVTPPVPAPAAKPAPAPRPAPAPPAAANPAVPPAVVVGPPAGPAVAPEVPGHGRPDTTGLDRAAEVKGTPVPGDHARSAGR